jgi:prolyl oligopeptidase PreP (S9A serine peptidase family)
LNIDANDPDGDTVSISYPILFDDDGVWETARGDAGNYELEAEVSDGDAVTIVPVRVVVEKLNVAPVIENLEDIEVDEGETITLDVEASDPDGDEIFISYSGFMTSDTYTTNYDDAGEYEVLVSVTDGRFTTEETVQITVNNKNRPPVFVVS